MYIWHERMEDVNITEFRKHLPVYLRRVSAGEEIRITRRGQAIARLVTEEDPAEAARQRLFSLRGKGFVGDVESPIGDAEWSGDTDNL
jgi:prevent-host-death family protein